MLKQRNKIINYKFLKKYPFYYEKNSQILYFAGKSYENIKNYKKAIDFYTRFYKSANKEYEKRQATFSLAKCNYLSGHYKESIKFFNEFIIKYFDSPVTHAAIYYLGSANEKLRKNIEAALLYETLISTFPNSYYINEAKKSLEKIYSLGLKKSSIEKEISLPNKETLVLTNIIYITNQKNIETTNYILVEQSSSSKESEKEISNLNVTNLPSEIINDPLLEALKKENLKNEEELNRYKEIIELKNRLLKMKEKLLEEKEGMVTEDEE